jgi:hypothetical protein
LRRRLKDFPMLYLKNALSGLGRHLHHLHDSALHAFQGPHRWWKLAFFAAMFMLPGGSIVVALVAWFDHRRQQPTPAAASATVVQADRRAAAPSPARAAAPAVPRRCAQPIPAPRAANALCVATRHSLLATPATLPRPCAEARRADARRAEAHRAPASLRP